MSFADHILDDLDAFVDVDNGFAVEALIGGETVTGIFDAEYAERLNTAGTAPVFMCKSADAAGIEQGYEVVIGDSDYTVVGIEPDGTGMTMLVLEEADE